MKFYFSGVESQRELDLLNQAGATHILMDLHQHATVNRYSTDARIAIDSGAYRDDRSTSVVNYDRQAKLYMRQILQWRTSDYDFFVAYDRINDPQLTDLFWREHFRRHRPTFIPVWYPQQSIFPDTQNQQLLEKYLDESELVGFGGMVGVLRGGEGEKDPAQKRRLNKERDKAIEQLGELASQWPQRFHLFGCASPQAINALAPYLHSADSSIWIRGRKYGKVLFQHTGHGRFTQAHAQYIPAYKDMTPDEICIANARNIAAFCHQSNK